MYIDRLLSTALMLYGTSSAPKVRCNSPTFLVQWKMIIGKMRNAAEAAVE